MKRKTKLRIDMALALALASAVILSMCGFTAACRDMYDNILRIRVIANSDSKEDQELKLSVRDSILASTGDIFAETSSYSDAVIAAGENLDRMEDIACNTVLSYGFDYGADVQIREEFFPTREYDGFTLPSGKYKTLVVTLGEGGGENWWCVMYPKVCVAACSGELTDSISEESEKYAQNSQKYVLKFKVVEIFQNFKNFL